MGTSDQMPIGPEDLKRSSTLHRGDKPDPVIDLHEDWKFMRKVSPQYCTPRLENSFQKIFGQASSVDGVQQDGCLPKLRLDRAVLLEREDKRGRRHDLINGQPLDRNVWVGTFGSQKPE